jgi:hypothetical protein
MFKQLKQSLFGSSERTDSALIGGNSHIEIEPENTTIQNQINDIAASVAPGSNSKRLMLERK